MSLGRRVAQCVARVGMQVRAASVITPHGKGGRSSISGSVATVFDATSYLGKSVVQRLGREGSQVICAYKGCELESRELRPMGDLGQIHLLEYGVLDTASIERALPYSNVAVNLAGSLRQTRHFSLEEHNVTSARNAARAAKQAGVERFVHVSALGANPDSASEYLRTKGLGEEAVKEEFPEATIIRPANIMGPEDFFISRLAQLAQMPGPLPLLNMGESIKMPVALRDVAQGICRTLQDKDAVGATYEFVGPKAYTMKEIVDYIGNAVRKPIKTVPLPDVASPIVLGVAGLAGATRLTIMPSEEEFYGYATSDVLTKKTPGLPELGIQAMSLEEHGIEILRRFRYHAYHDDIDAALEEASKGKSTIAGN